MYHPVIFLRLSFAVRSCKSSTNILELTSIWFYAFKGKKKLKCLIFKPFSFNILHYYFISAWLNILIDV